MIQKIRDYYNKINPPVKASLWFLVCGFLQKAISLLTTPIFTRVMTEVEYGRFSVYNSWFNILQIIVSLNLAAGVYTRGLVKNEDKQEEFTSSLLGLSTVCIGFWTVIYLIFNKQINSWVQLPFILMVAMLVEIWSTAAFQFWSNKERVNYKYKKLVIITLTYVIFRPVFSLIGIYLVDNSHQVEARVLATTIVNVVLFSGLFIVMMKNGKKFFDKQNWIYALKFNIPLIPHYLSQIVLSQSDRLMIDKYCGRVEAGYYNVAYTLSMVLIILNTSISGTMNPWMYKAIKNNEVSKIGKVSYGILGIIAIANFAIVAMAPEVLKILAPSNFQVAVWVIPPVTVSVFFMFLYNLFATFEYYFEKTYFVTVATIISAILNVVLNYIFIPKYGFIAAGYTTLICYMLYAFAHYVFMKYVNKHYLKDNRVYNGAIIVAIAIGLMILSCFIMIFYEMPIIRYCILLGIVVVVLLKIKEIKRIFKLVKGK